MTSFNRQQLLPLFWNIFVAHAAVCMAVLKNGRNHTRSSDEAV